MCPCSLTLTIFLQLQLPPRTSKRALQVIKSKLSQTTVHSANTIPGTTRVRPLFDLTLITQINICCLEKLFQRTLAVCIKFETPMSREHILFHASCGSPDPSSYDSLLEASEGSHLGYKNKQTGK